ncbi:NAD(P)/FAD-dependent oxidoreductase [Piscinibacter koreensis]|uniref:NAD(P)/FAD-dependent oxidoreductase n=1 Tax=Piscinibacter koreensis TaxID=2742824 RepID=UPI001C37ACC4|nr:FAD-dependent oxidoreductase [Schlegelella koreensis]
MSPATFVIIGSGIAAASLGYFLAPHARVVLLEREEQPGYHSTGRSAALFMESYGPPQVRALTMASRAFLERPPAGFAEHPILTPRGALMVAEPGQDALLDAHWGVMQTVSPTGRLLDAVGTRALVPVLRPERVLGGVYEPDAMDIDVHALHQGYLRGIRASGGELVCGAEVVAIERAGAGRERWRVSAASGTRVDADVVVNAAGAWADVVGRMAGARPLGVVAKRRAAFVFAPPEGIDSSAWPLFGGVDHTWYVKPDAGQLLGSPANEDPVEPQDVQPDELDIALGVDRIQAMTTLEVPRVIRRWAGLRSFVADGDLVGGFDPELDGFFWVVGQGGYGIQTSAAMGEACAALLRGAPLPAHVARFGVGAATLSPARLATPG